MRRITPLDVLAELQRYDTGLSTVEEMELISILFAEPPKSASPRFMLEHNWMRPELVPVDAYFDSPGRLDTGLRFMYDFDNDGGIYA